MDRTALTLAEVSRQHKIWIIDPVARCVQYIADEAVLGGLMHRAVGTFEGFNTYLNLARKEIVRRSGQGKALHAIDALLVQQPLNARLASEHVRSDFALLNAHSLVAIWAALESCIEETAVLILMNDATMRARMIDDAKKSGRIDQTLSDEDSCRNLVRLWEFAQPKAPSAGLRFERLLSFFGLGAALDPALDAQLADINAIRNCLMHRRGIIDERAVREAPSLAAHLHKPIVIKRADYLRHHQAVSTYTVALMGRITVSPFAVTT